MEKLKDKIKQKVDMIDEDLINLSKNIHANPELSFQEFKAVGWLKDLMAQHNFKVESPLGELATAFKARYTRLPGGPRVAFLAEYDALRGKGHACGHNIIAACAAGAAIGLSAVLDQMPGEVILLGTPAEEGGGGKILLIEAGEFAQLDYALMIHPGNSNIIGRGGLAATLVTVEFKGKAAHSSGPERGINALQALIEVFKGIDSIRGSLRGDVKINGIIKNGGEASNIIPDYASGEFTVRAATRDYLQQILARINDLVRAAELITGAKASISSSLIYAERYPNLVMAEKFKENMAGLGEQMCYPDPGESLGSSDIGNVSMVVPTIHSYLRITEKAISGHTEEFAAAAISSRAEEVIIKGAKGLALTGFDILREQGLRAAIHREFNQVVPGREGASK